ncbi:hypothetical protein GGI19_002388 [Coemansia pectinata]|uniref:Uncharacterized protein n=1 Tax=Coemansia pectinata TaxID=1052879 RepID=A0A9W8LCA0_9FUNG|nr:hypothetical protein GGI19_002388 [Coemansia pectinata]
MLSDKPDNGPSEGNVFELCPLELSRGTHLVLQYMLLYRNTQLLQERGTRPFSSIQAAFERLLDLYPILRGYRVQLPDRNVIATGDNSKPGPLFEIIDASQMTVDEFEKVQFHRDQWPTEVDKALKSRTADVDRLIAGTVVSFADGYLVGLSVSHIVADGGSVFHLLCQWASLAQKMAADGDKLPMPDLPIDFDHPGFWAKLEAHPHEPHPFVEYLDSQDFGDLAALQAKMSTWYATGSLNGGEKLAIRVLRVSPAAIDAIAKEYNMPTDSRPALHGVQILYALMWQRYVATVIEMQKESDMAYTLPVFLMMMCSLRQMTPAPNYVGNAVGTVLVPCDTKDILALPIIDLARLVKEHLRQLTPGGSAHYINEAFNGDGSFFIKAVYLCNRAESQVNISSIARLAFFDIDFGHDKPIALLCGTQATEGMMYWMPSVDGGIDIHYGLKDDVYNVLKRDMVLNKFIEFVN